MIGFGVWRHSTMVEMRKETHTVASVELERVRDTGSKSGVAGGRLYGIQSAPLNHKSGVASCSCTPGTTPTGAADARSSGRYLVCERFYEVS